MGIDTHSNSNIHGENGASISKYNDYSRHIYSRCPQIRKQLFLYQMSLKMILT